MPKNIVAALAAIAVISPVYAEEMRGGALLEKALYAPGELLNRKITVNAAVEPNFEVIRDGKGASYQKIRIAPEVGKGIFFAGAVFYCINVNNEPVESKRKYTFEASYLETKTRMPLPGTVGGGVKEALFACGNFR